MGRRTARIIRQENAAIAATPRLLRRILAQGPGEEPERFCDLAPSVDDPFLQEADA
jgi:hypothetical protein